MLFDESITLTNIQLFSSILFRFEKMQVESGINKWTGRVPPLDLSNVSVCPCETEQRWHKIQSNPKKMGHNMKGKSDGLPIGRFIHILLCVWINYFIVLVYFNLIIMVLVFFLNVLFFFFLFFCALYRST